jgi:hypothetical protein
MGGERLKEVLPRRHQSLNGSNPLAGLCEIETWVRYKCISRITRWLKGEAEGGRGLRGGDRDNIYWANTCRLADDGENITKSVHTLATREEGTCVGRKVSQQG